MFTDPQFGERSVSRFSSNIVAAASEFQKDLIREHIVESRAVLKANGIHVAERIPSGYSYNRVFSRLVAIPEEVELVKDFFAPRALCSSEP